MSAGPETFVKMSQLVAQIGQSTKWTKEQISVLINAYKEETCLYAIQSPNYHNKHLRAEALMRVCNAVNNVRLNTTTKECQTKFHNLRNQFNVENAKRRSSIKSGAGTNDIYVPSLWYFNSMLFLEEYYGMRKTKSSKLPDALQQTEVTINSQSLNALQESEKAAILIDERFNAGGHLQLFLEDSESHDIEDHSPMTSTQSSTSPTIITSTQPQVVHDQSKRSKSPTPGTSSTTRPVKKRRISSESNDTYVGAITSIAESLRQSVSTAVHESRPLSTVQTRMKFLESILNEIQSKELQLDVISTLVQTAINAKTADMKKQI